MQNQAAVEALYSATYVENYLETVENLPNELQTHISRLRELDLCLHEEFLCDLDELTEAFESDKATSASQRAVLAKIQKGLIIAQDLGDDKLLTVQAITDLIDNKSRHLEHDKNNLNFDSDEEDEDEDVAAPTPTSTKKQTDRSAGGHTNGVAKAGSAATGSHSSAKKRAAGNDDRDKIKRRKKQQEKSRAHEDRSDEEVTPVVSTTSSGRVTSKSRGGGMNSSNAGASTSSAAHASSSKKPSSSKRKTGGASKRSDRHDADSDNEVDLSHMDIDPDEPTYCLCGQVSYGDMIGCDNDLCPLEWYHFNCVGLTSGPKGKWYCPKCRGDKATVMKPKQQFLKELEKFNKERGEKMMKQNG